MEDKIKLFIEKLKEMPDFDSVKFVIFFGSFAEKRQNKLSDIDFAIYYDGNKKQRFRFRLKLLSRLPDAFDVQIFQDLPLYVRMSVLKGKIIYCKGNDLDFAYDIAYQTIKSFEDFRKGYYDYIKLEKIR